MANNYLQFSECIDDLSPEEIKFFQDAFAWEPPYNEDNELPDDFEFPGWYDQDAEGVHFDYDLDKNDRSLHVYAEEYGNLDTLGELILEFIQKFRPEAIFRLTYAETCSRMRLGEFGGGAMIVHRGGIEFVNSHGWASQKVNEILDKRAAEKAP